MEIGKWDEANDMKVNLEEAQRGRRKRREAEQAAQKAANVAVEQYTPKWFKIQKCPITSEEGYVFTNEYWDCKAKQDWSRCEHIYQLPESDDA